MEETAEKMTSKLEADAIFMFLNRGIILSIGNELLIGKVLNTNAQWLSKELTALGFLVEECVSVQDSVLAIAEAFRNALAKRPQVIISTGGLGPTFDDKTVEGLARALNLPLVLDPQALASIKEKYASRGLQLTPERVKMAYLPLGATSLENTVGTAPGVYIRHKGTLIFVLPGPPREAEAVFKTHVQRIIEKTFGKVESYEASVIIRGVPESEFAPYVREAMEKFKGVYIKSHPKGFELGAPVIEIHITSFGRKYFSELEKCFKFIVEQARKLGGEITATESPTIKK
ncbi:MAG: nicotinamide mononucleotide deamidase-related protein [Infirmifilum sp.]